MSLEREAPSGSAENLQRIFDMSYQRSLFLPSDRRSTVLDCGLREVTLEAC